MVRRHIIPVVVTVLCSCLIRLCADTPDEPGRRSIGVYWTDTPPVIDGKMDDACWLEADAAEDFRVYRAASKKATQQTEVRVCYDAENLYLFYKLYEERMDKLVYGPPEDMRDPPLKCDSVELFLQPNFPKGMWNYYHFMVSPLGTRHDETGKGGWKKAHLFNPDWVVKPGIHDKYWTLEIAIPFTELPCRDEFLGTPQPGAVWKVSFCRNQQYLAESSQWTPSTRGFHDPTTFGAARFMGRKVGPPLPGVKRESRDLIRFGPGVLDFSVDGEAEDLELEYALLHDDKPHERKTAPVTTERFSVPYHITDGGKWGMHIRLRAAGKTLYTGYTFSLLPRIKEMLADIQGNIELARKKLQGFEHPIAGELGDKVSRLTREAREPLKKMQRSRELTGKEWATLENDVRGLKKMWKDVQFDLHLIRLYPESDEVKAFAVGAAAGHEKIYRNTRFAGPMDQPILLAAAGGEYESFQLVIIPFWRSLENTTIRFTDLKGDNGTIAATNISYSLVDYVRLKGVEPDDLELNQYEPDILWPGKPFDVTKGQVRSVWLDVYVPRGTEQGDYKGNIFIESAEQTVAKELRVRAYGFDLPEKTSLKNHLGFSPGYRWAQFYGGLNYTPELYEKHARVLSRYRITCFVDNWQDMWPQLKIFHELDGHFSFDFSVWEKFIRIGLKYGGNAYSASLGGNYAALQPLSIPSRTTVIDRTTGKEEKLSKYVDDYRDWQKRPENKGKYFWEESRIYREYLTAYVRFLKKLGILEMSHWELFDEPNSATIWMEMIRHHKFLRKLVPELPLMNLGTDPTIRRAGKTAVGLCDGWGPNLKHLPDEVLNAVYERRRRFGETFWFYTCAEGFDGNRNISPYILYNRSYLGPRIHAWLAWKLKADGMYIFALNQVPRDNVVKDPKNRWPNMEWLVDWSRGSGMLIYPGPNYEVIPGMRLAGIRDGLEDYEYFKVLHDKWAYVDPETQKELFEEIERELSIDSEIIKTFYIWTKDVRKLEQKRERLAALIQKATVIAEE